MLTSFSPVARKLTSFQQGDLPRERNIQMKQWKRKFEALACAVAFAEAGEWKAAMELASQSDRPAKRPSAKDEQRMRLKSDKRLRV